MDITNYSVPVIMATCWCIGFIVKKWIADVDDKFIPTIVAIMGVLLNVWLNGWVLNVDILLGGLASGLASTGINELVTQFIKNAED
ncbi:MAG: phage holin family protein [Bacteroidales bacterium]|nr:phage holin family protein [Bacteroidales bacterium]